MANPADRVGKAKGRTSGPGGSDFNRYPDNVGHAGSGGQHYMLISSYKMDDARMTTQSTAFNQVSTTIAGETKMVSRPVDWACALYIPPGALKQTYTGKYSGLAYGGATIAGMGTTGDIVTNMGESMAAAGQAGVSIIPKFLGGGGTAESYNNQWNQLVNATASAGKETAAFAAVATGKGKQLLAAGGIAPNQHMALVYDGPGEFRDHSFSFTFWPKNHDSANQVSAIVGKFKQRMLPGGSAIEANTVKSAFWGYPNLFTIKFFVAGEEYKAMKIYRSVLTSMSADYMGAQGTVAFHTRTPAHPVATKLDLTFKETVHVTNEDIPNDWH